ncbi:mediator of RNA polymerase II transcription subunit 16-like isoform X1 [Biomphalaria glabrata]|nr:mediator of RNA polymerase II transcription subunit 16-like isoform X1 [Biomphalaria glabrata]
MELVYSIDFKTYSKENEFSFDEKICCSLSCRNIVAFSRARISEANGDKVEMCYEVCVVDLDKPWQEYEVTTYPSPVKYMRWDPAGTALLVVNAAGRFSLWTMKNNLINVWEESGHVDMDKEEILVLAWLHNGSQVLFNPEARDVITYPDKFSRAKMIPSVTQFGKKPVDGWIAITSTAMVHVGLIPDKGSALVTAKASIGQTNSHIIQADVAFMPDGQILIATSDGYLTSSVHCYVAAVTLKNHVCSIRTSPSASFFLKKQSVPDGTQEEPRLTRLSFLSRENSEILLACWGTSSFSCVEAWHLIDQTIPLNRMFQNAAVTEYAYKTKRWIHKSSFTQRSALTDIARPKLPISRSFNMESTNFLSYFACTYRDGTIKIVHRQSYQVIHTAFMEQLINFKSLVPTDNVIAEPFEKRARLSVPHLVSVVQTNTGCGLVGLDESRLYLFRIFNSRDGSLQLMPPFVILLLEYTMFVGLDVWDVLLAVRQGMVEGIVEKLNTNFQKQSVAFQELLQQRLLRLKMALYSCLSSGNQRAADCRAMITLHAITTVLKSCLRPKSVTAQDKSPSEKLTNLCSVSMEKDIDQIIKNIDVEEFILDSFKKAGSVKPSCEASLQALQPFIQWITDFILHLLAAVSMYPNPTYPGSTLIKNPQVLCTLRELLIIIRIWGRFNPVCLPVFMTTVSMDALSYLFHLVTKALITVREGAALESDQTFVDECCNLPSEILLPNYKKTFGEEMNCYLAFSQPFPINYQFGEEPDFLFNPRYSSRIYPLDLCLDADQKYDCVRQIQLGVNPKEPLRECVRCHSLSLRRKVSATKSSLLKAWELRFVKSCLCGGHWKLKTSQQNTLGQK